VQLNKNTAAHKTDLAIISGCLYFCVSAQF